MHIPKILTILLVAVLCYFAGFKMGQRDYLIHYTGKQSVATPEPIAAEAPVVTAPEATTPAPEPEPEATLKTPQPTPAIDESTHATRAEQRFITFTDNQGRTLVAELIETKADALKIRRQSDRRIFELPIQMLSAEDQAFAAYLQRKNQPKMDEEDLNAIFDELFK